MVSSSIARAAALLACAVLAYDSARATFPSQQSTTTSSGASATAISPPATLSSKAVKNPYRRIFPLPREIQARAQTVEIAPVPKAPKSPEIICGLQVFHPDPKTDAKIKREVPKDASEFSIRRLQPKICR